METLVDLPRVTIKVRDMANAWVCARCRGTGDVPYFIYDGRWSDPDRLCMWSYQRCPSCHGQGHGYSRATPAARGGGAS